MNHSLRPALLMLASSFLVGGCGGGGGSDGGGEVTILESVTGDFAVCQDTAGSSLWTNANSTGWIGKLEVNNSTFLVGHCRAVILFDQADASAIPEGTIPDSIRLFVSIADHSATTPSSNMVVESIQWEGSESLAYGAVDQSISPVIFTPSVGGLSLNAGGIPPVPGIDGLIAYRIRMQNPDPFTGTSSVWYLAMSEAGTGTRAKLTYFWTP